MTEAWKKVVDRANRVLSMPFHPDTSEALVVDALEGELRLRDEQIAELKKYIYEIDVRTRR